MTSAPSPSVPVVSFFADPFKKLFFQHQPQRLKANSSLGFHASVCLVRFFVLFYRALFFTTHPLWPSCPTIPRSSFLTLTQRVPFRPLPIFSFFCQIPIAVLVVARQTKQFF